MYCCRTYHFYIGLAAPEKKPVRKSKPKVQITEDREKIEQERLKKINSLEIEKAELEGVYQTVEDISLIGVQVQSEEYGTGQVIAQDEKMVNKIRVHFDSFDKSFILHSKYKKRPKFENDEEIVSAFTEYSDACERIKVIDELLEKLR